MVTCGESGAASTPLAGSGWQLTSIESPAGPTTVDDPAAFTVAFDADGRAAFRLDCNSGGGSTFRVVFSDPQIMQVGGGYAALAWSGMPSCVRVHPDHHAGDPDRIATQQPIG